MQDHGGDTSSTSIFDEYKAISCDLDKLKGSLEQALKEPENPLNETYSAKLLSLQKRIDNIEAKDRSTNTASHMDMVKRKLNETTYKYWEVESTLRKHSQAVAERRYAMFYSEETKEDIQEAVQHTVCVPCPNTVD
jgi:t-SNARE complex subunit (syntaxin)